MIKKAQSIQVAKSNEIDSGIEKEQTHFTKKIVRYNALSCNFAKSDDLDIKEAEKESRIGLKVLGADGGLQEMLVAQMLSIHNLQQISMAMANRTQHNNNGQYFANVAIKLTNTFVQQANLLNKLQGNGEQKIIVERVDVHNGGQAIVGNINNGSYADKVKNENDLM